MEKESFYKLTQNPLHLNSETLKGLKKLTEDFPYFHAAWVLYLKNLKELNDPGFEAALRKAAPLLPDRKQLYRFLHNKFKPSAVSQDLDKAGIRMLDYTIETADVPFSGESLIDKFLSASPGSLKLGKQPAEGTSTDTENDFVARSLVESDEMVTETLANIYAEQKKFDKALEAFKKLSLKYPEKNSYFATRIEEIEKLKNI